MLRRIRSSLVIVGLLLSLVTITANAGTAIGKAKTSASASRSVCYAPSTIAGVAAARVPCDISFTTTPTFSCDDAFPQAGVYTIRNNTPVTLGLTYFRIEDNDSLPTSDVTITANTCGSSLAAGASCSITVTLATEGPYNRVLQVGVNSRQGQLESAVITPTTGCNTPSPVPGAFTCALNSTSTFATLAGTTITNTGNTILNGDLGLSPGTSVTGFPPGVVNGTQHITDATAAAAQVDLTTLYTCLQALPCDTSIGTTDQAGATLSSPAGTQTVYCSGSTVNNTGALTLSGTSTSVIVIQAGSALNFGSGASIVLTGGITAANVFWQVGSSATLGTGSVFSGTIAALSSITMNTGATATGRMLARNAAVSFDTNTTNMP